MMKNKNAKIFTHDEAMKASTTYFEGDELASTVFVTKYALRDETGSLLEDTPIMMHHRLAREFARIEAKYPNPMNENEIFALFDHFKYIVPQGSPMSAIGNANQIQSLSNCFVIKSPNDAYGSIARADEDMLQIMKRRGGVGVDLSNIRPKGVRVNNAAGTSDGVGIFMERYSNTTREVAQHNRRGALMQTIDVRHPDVETFINIKQDPKKVTGANVSVRVTDDFMRAVDNETEFTLRWPVEASITDARLTRTIVARDLWKQMMHAAWASAEPGILFWDTVTRLSMADEFADKGYKTITTNPCGEIGLNEADSCRLLLINLLSYVKEPFTLKAFFDFDLFKDHVIKAQRLMDDLVDLELEAVDRIIAKVQQDPEEESEKARELALWKNIRKVGSNGRRTGLGITALGDALAAMNIVYGSQDSIKETEKIYKTLAINAHVSSVNMAVERGPFPVWESGRYINNEFATRLMKASDQETNEKFFNFGRRNIALTTTAPAGSVSTLTQTTSGIEPAYLLHYKRRKKLVEGEIENGARVDFVDALGDKWQEYDVYHHGVKRWMNITGETDVIKSPYHKATSADVNWIASVDLQSAAQNWVEHSISKTINLPADATEELVSEVYIRAWKLGLKGVTVYRDGCRSGVLVSAEEKPVEASKTPSDDIGERHAPKRPKALECDIVRATVKGEKYLVLVGLFNGKPYEIFAGMNDRVEVPKKIKKGTILKNGKGKDNLASYNLSFVLDEEDDPFVLKDIASLFDNSLYSSFTRMVSLSLRHGTPLQFVCEQLAKSRDEDMSSFAKVVSRVLKHYIVDGTKPASEKVCASCGSDNVTYQEGCVTCLACAYSKCS